MKSMKRRSFIKNMAAGTSVFLLATTAQAKQATPKEIEGPYYPITPQKDKDADLTKVQGKSGIAKGEIIEVSGQVTDQNGNPVEGATIDLWQANSFGKYHHPHDETPQPVDDNFQSWAIIQSGKEGRFKIKTVMPGAYLVPEINRYRTPHIHFKIGKNGYEQLLTQMYFPGHKLNANDPLIKRKSTEETKLMTSRLVSDSDAEMKHYQHDMVMQKL